MILCVSVRYLSGHLGPFFHNCDLRLLRLRVPRLREGCKPFSSSVTTPPTFGASRGRVLSAAVPRDHGHTDMPWFNRILPECLGLQAAFFRAYEGIKKRQGILKLPYPPSRV